MGPRPGMCWGRRLRRRREVLCRLSRLSSSSPLSLTFLFGPSLSSTACSCVSSPLHLRSSRCSLRSCAFSAPCRSRSASYTSCSSLPLSSCLSGLCIALSVPSSLPSSFSSLSRRCEHSMSAASKLESDSKTVRSRACVLALSLQRLAVDRKRREEAEEARGNGDIGEGSRRQREGNHDEDERIAKTLAELAFYVQKTEMKGMDEMCRRASSPSSLPSTPLSSVSLPSSPSSCSSGSGEKPASPIQCCVVLHACATLLSQRELQFSKRRNRAEFVADNGRDSLLRNEQKELDWRQLPLHPFILPQGVAAASHRASAFLSPSPIPSSDSRLDLTPLLPSSGSSVSYLSSLVAAFPSSSLSPSFFLTSFSPGVLLRHVTGLYIHRVFALLHLCSVKQLVMLANDLCRLLPLLPFPSSVEQVHVYSRALSARIREEEEHRRRFRENARRKKRKKRTEQARISMSKQGYFSSESSSSFSCPWASSGQSRPAEKDAAACDRNEGEAEREDSRFKSAPPTLPAALHALRLRKSPLAPSSLHAPTKAAEEAACESPEKGQEEGGNEQRVFPAENQSVASLSSRPPLQGSPLWTSRSRVETFGSLSFTPDKAVASALLVLVLRRISLRLEKKRGGSHLDGVSPRSVSVLANAVALLCTATLPQLLDEAAQAAGAARRDSRLSTLSMLPSEVASEVEAGDTTEGADEGTEESERQREKQRRTQEENRNMGRRPEIDRGCEEDRQAIGAVSPEGKRGAEEGDAQKLPGFRGKTGTLHVPRASKVQWRRDEGRQEQIHASAWTFAAKANDAGRRSVIDLSSQPNGQLFCRAFFSPDSPSLQDNSSLRSAASLSLPSSSSSPSPSSSAPGEDCPEMLTARLAAMASTAGRCLLFGETKNGEESFLIQSCVRQLEIFKGKDATMLLQALVRLHAAPVCGGANQGKPGELLHRLPRRLLECIPTMSPTELSRLLPAAASFLVYCVNRVNTLFPPEKGTSSGRRSTFQTRQKSEKRENFMSKTASLSHALSSSSLFLSSLSASPSTSSSAGRLSLPVSSLERRSERQRTRDSGSERKRDGRRKEGGDNAGVGGDERGQEEDWDEVIQLWLDVVQTAKQRGRQISLLREELAQMKAEVAEERREGGTERTSQDVEKLKETVDKVDVRLQSTAWSVLAQK